MSQKYFQNCEPTTSEEKYLQAFGKMVDKVFPPLTPQNTMDNPELKLSVPMERYHSSPGISRSDILNLLRSPAYYKYCLSRVDDPTPAMILGKAVHTRLLEPHLFSQEFCYAPAIDRRTKAGKAEYEQFLLDNPNKTILNTDWEDILENIAARLDVSQWISEHTTGEVYIEPSIWFEHEKVLCKARPDILVVSEGAVICTDLKTTEDASRLSFERSLTRYSLHIQAAHYINALQAIYKQPIYFYFLVVEKQSPFDYSIFALDPRFFEIANKSIDKALNRYKEASETNIWTGYPKEVQTLYPPVWMEYQAMEEE